MRLLLGLTLAFSLATATAPSALATAAGFHLELVVSGFKRPLYVAAHNDSHFLYVVEQRGIVRVLTRVDDESPWVKQGIFLDMRSLVAGPFIGRGLLGIAFDPNYESSGKFFAFYTRKHSVEAKNGDIVIAEFTRNTNLRADLASRRTVLIIPHPSTYHFGGWLGFGPDGYLWLTTGHALGAPDSVPQDTTSRLAKLLRMNPHAGQGKAAQIPVDNPYVGSAGNDLVYAIGLRNPWRASFDRLTGDLWLSDVGLYNWEEVNRFSPATGAAAANLGWRMCEGNHVEPQPETGDEPCDEPGTVLPLIEYSHENGDCSVTGGYVYRGTQQTNLYGRYFYGDFCSGNIWSVPADHSLGQEIDSPLATTVSITSFGEDTLGELYVTGLGGTVWHVVQD